MPLHESTILVGTLFHDLNPNLNVIIYPLPNWWHDTTKVDKGGNAT